MKSVMLLEGARVVTVEQPRKLMFKLSPEGHKALADWVGLSFLAAFYLKRRYAWVSLWAFLLVVGSVATLISPPRTKFAPRFDLMACLLGIVLLAASGFARWRPYPVLFLVDAFFFSFVAVRLTLRVLLHGISPAWLLLVLLLAWLAVTGVKHFVRFRGTAIPRTTRKP